MGLSGTGFGHFFEFFGGFDCAPLGADQGLQHAGWARRQATVPAVTVQGWFVVTVVLGDGAQATQVTPVPRPPQLIPLWWSLVSEAPHPRDV